MKRFRKKTALALSIFVLGTFLLPNLKAIAANSVFSDAAVSEFKSVFDTRQPRKIAPKTETTKQKPIKPKKSTETTETNVKNQPKQNPDNKIADTSKDTKPKDDQVAKTENQTLETEAEDSQTEATDNTSTEQETVAETVEEPENNLALDIEYAADLQESVDGNIFPIRNLGNDNVFSRIDKIPQALRLMYGPYSEFAYGPYSVSPDLYKWPYKSTENITHRILALKKVLISDQDQACLLYTSPSPRD